MLRMRRRLVHGCRAVNVMVPRNLAALPNAVLMRGNHELTIGGRPCPPAGHETAYLAHFPVRSPGQYLAKIVIAALQNEVIADRSPEAGWHYRGPYELAKRDPPAFVAGYADAACRYLLLPGEKVDPEEKGSTVPVVEDPFPCRVGRLLYTKPIDDKARASHAILGYMEELARRFGILTKSLNAESQVSLDMTEKLTAQLRSRLDQLVDRAMAQEVQLVEKERVIQELVQALTVKESVIEKLVGKESELAAKERVIQELAAALKGWKADAAWTKKAKGLMTEWNTALDGYQKPTNAPVPTYAQVVGVVNKKAEPRDYMLTAAGGLPGETMKNWRCKTTNSYDLEFGFSCMGYEIAGGWGAKMADPTRDVIVMVGDGSYMMMNADIYSSVLTGHKLIVIVCDNGGYAVINRLQQFKGTPGFNNLLKDCKTAVPAFSVDFVKHAQSMGALARKVSSLAELELAMDWAKGNDRTTVISIVTDAYTWTPGDALWDVGVPQVSNRDAVKEQVKYQADVRSKQRVGV